MGKAVGKGVVVGCGVGKAVGKGEGWAAVYKDLRTGHANKKAKRNIVLLYVQRS